MIDPAGLCRVEGGIVPVVDDRGLPRYSAGNTAVNFAVMHLGRKKALRCYLKSAPHLKEIYGDQFVGEGLYVFGDTPAEGRWVDVVLTDWIEGEALDAVIRQAVVREDRERLHDLSVRFDRLAADMVSDDWAHGDLKPENIIVSPSGKLHLIDFDARYAPMFHGEHSPELGTAAYQHPARSLEDFDASLDDYPAALIATALHVLAIDPKFGTDNAEFRDGLLFDPRHIAKDRNLDRALTLFDREGRAAAYRIAELLRHPTLKLPHLKEFLDFSLHELQGYPKTGSADLELAVDQHRWGYIVPRGTWAIPPLYAEGFDFSEGLAAVRLNRTWSFITPEGRPQIRCADCDAVKPFSAGRAIIQRKNQRFAIDRNGKEFAI